MKTDNRLSTINYFLLIVVLLFALVISAGCAGKNGKDGVNGTGCTSQQLDNGVLVHCGDTESVIYNGRDGANGTDGRDGKDLSPGAYTIVDIVNPCGEQGDYDEVLLQLANGQILTHYSHGNKQFLSLIGPGSYQTSDGYACNFTINSNGLVSW
jgi:hypothetical protein